MAYLETQLISFEQPFTLQPMEENVQEVIQVK